MILKKNSIKFLATIPVSNFYSVAKNLPILSQTSNVLSQSSLGISKPQTNGTKLESELLLVTSFRCNTAEFTKKIKAPIF